MKKILLSFFSFALALNAFSQVLVTYKNNSPLPGDTLITQDFELKAPGNAGPGVVWDFSAVTIDDELNIGVLSGNTDRAPGGLADYTSILSDKGNEYFYHTDEDKSEIVGLWNKDISVVLSDPILKIKYPLGYGTKFSDDFSGTGSHRSKSDIGISGTYSLEADAWGTLILADRILHNVLRLRVEENKIQLNPCNIYEIKTTSYLWYAPSARYPVIGFTLREMKTNGGEPVVTTTATINQQMTKTGIAITGMESPADEQFTVSLFPNPFIDKLTYNYFLRKQMPVTIELVDMTGKTLIVLAKEKIQSEGLHTGELDAAKYDLKMGIYYLRFKFGDKEMVSKVVKM